MEPKLRLECAAPEQLPALLDLARRCFDVDFPALLPKVYGPQGDPAARHVVLYENDRPAGLYCLLIHTYSVAGFPLRVGEIGTVCVAKEFRGRGYLERMLRDAEARLCAADCDLSVLGGQRQRYERFGYAKTGTQWEFLLTPRNTRGLSAGGITLTPLEDKRQWLAEAQKLYSALPVQGPRGTEEIFLTVLQSWRSKPYAVLCSGAFAGYCVLSREGGLRLLELVLRDENQTQAFCAALMEHLQAEVTVQLPCWQRTCLAAMAEIAEESVCRPNRSHRIFHWERVIEAALRLSDCRRLPEGWQDLTLRIGGGPCLGFSQGEMGIVAVPRLSANVHLSDTEAARLLFGPDSGILQADKQVPAGLLPLPMAFSWLDGV